MDKHLNFFFAYNRSTELIENNLTRAFVITLMFLTKSVRNSLLRSLNMNLSQFDFGNANFALQNNIEKNPNSFKNKFLLTLSSESIFYLEKIYEKLDKNIIKSTLINKKVPSEVHDNEKKYLKYLCTGSIPDAWVYDGSNNTFCILIECKKQNDIIQLPQILRHAYENFGYTDLKYIKSITIRLTWYDILETFLTIYKQIDILNDQEKMLVNHFINYLSFFGYSYFKGFRFDKLFPAPAFSLNSKLFNFLSLKPLC